MKSKQLRDARILIVDDQQANIEILVDYFELKNYTDIIYTIDSLNAIEMIIEYKPDIILLDLAMPEKSGFEILAELQEIIPADEYLPVLVLTADVTLDARRKALMSGASDFLTKPFDLIELQARVNTHLEIRFKNEQINEYVLELEKLVATKDKFFSIIAHDVRNPFAGIVTFTRILLNQFERLEKKDIEENLSVIYSSAQHGQELLENLLEWSRSQTGKIEINPKTLVLKNSVDNITKTIESQLKNKRITFETFIPDEVSVVTDREMLETILRNLISNALKFTPEGGKITVSGEMQSDEVVISVKDTGIGIAGNDLEKLFRIDSKLQSRKGTANETGTGLGLILCREFVEKLSGSISVRSKIGEGTTFTIKLPINNLS